MLPGSTRAEPRLTVIIVAGGEARRLPGKLDLLVEGLPMLLRVRRALASVGPCIVAAKIPFAQTMASSLDARVVLDDRPGDGPLAALANAAAKVETRYFFAAAGDMPGIDAAYVRRVEGAAESASWPDAVVPAWPDGSLEPLAAIYATAPWLISASAALRKGRRNVTAALDGLKVVHFPVEPGDEAALANVNTPEDYQRWLSRGRPDER